MLPLLSYVSAATLCYHLAAPAPAAADENPTPPAATIGDFRLRDFYGAEHSLADLATGRKLVVVAVLGTECPLARLYAGRLVKLARQYKPRGVAFVAIDPNRQDSLLEMAHFARTFGLTFPLLKDGDNAVADELGALRTPEVFVLDESRAIRYRGRIDDQHNVGGGQRARASHEYLRAALDELLAGRPVSQPETEAVGCLIGRVRAPADAPSVTWSKHIAPLFQRHCQDCHRPGQIGPFPLLTYDDAQGWGEMIREVVEQKRMPPWHASPDYGHFVNDARLSDAETQLIFDWVDQGTPEGNSADAPPPRAFLDGWQITQPDQVVYMSDEPFAVPAEGTVPYQWFVADPHFTEDKWIRAVECRPGNPAVVHHVTVYFKPPGFLNWKLDLNDRINLLGGYTPGKRPVEDVKWKGQARFVPAGSQLVFEMHYTPNGAPQTDRSSIALVFADPRDVKKQFSCVMVANTSFTIPPGEPDHRVEASYTFDEDSLLYALSPHMHYRGRSFRFEAEYPDGAREILLDVPRFDFNWQTDYQLVEPKRMPAGTRMHCLASFDNSADNLANPDPTQPVRWGDQTWEEMMLGTMAIAPEHQDLQAGTGKPVVVLHARPPLWRILAATCAAAALLIGILFVARRMVRRWREPVTFAGLAPPRRQEHQAT